MTLAQNILDAIRSHLTPQTRELLYLLTGVGAAGVGVDAIDSGSLSGAVTSVVLTGITLLVAVINSRPAAAAAYAAAGAVAGLLQILAVQHETAAWAGYVGVAAAVLTKAIAALRTPTSLQLAVHDLVPIRHSADAVDGDPTT